MCNKLKCTRCHYEGLKGTENYCPICGLNLKGGMTKDEVIEQIDDLINEVESHIEADPFYSEVFRNDKEALETVKAVYKRTVQEMKTPEHSTIYVELDEESAKRAIKEIEMNKKELYKQIEDLHHNFKNYESVESTEDDVRALEIIMDLIMLGAGAFTTDELLEELMKRKGVLVLEKNNLSLDYREVG